MSINRSRAQRTLLLPATTAMAGPTRAGVLHLYRDFVRSSRRFNNYNFREYFMRRSRDTFKRHREASGEELQQLWVRAQQEIGVLKRQSVISQMYTFDKLVVEQLHK
ncbi:AaceriADL113Cp [[Ashbya] aceris (nom. inval.)]|nr:AaceriADL113Cp [[Ashbya] aceris (nom. inval.)]